MDLCGMAKKYDNGQFYKSILKTSSKSPTMSKSGFFAEKVRHSEVNSESRVDGHCKDEIKEEYIEEEIKNDKIKIKFEDEEFKVEVKDEDVSNEIKEETEEEYIKEEIKDEYSSGKVKRKFSDGDIKVEGQDEDIADEINEEMEEVEYTKVEIMKKREEKIKYEYSSGKAKKKFEDVKVEVKDEYVDEIKEKFDEIDVKVKINKEDIDEYIMDRSLSGKMNRKIEGFVSQDISNDRYAVQWESSSGRKSVLTPVAEASLLPDDPLLPHGSFPRDKICDICTDKKNMFEVRHGHYSSERYRLDSIANGQTNYFCPSCKDVHGVELQTKRRKVALCSSTLHNVVSHLNIKTVFHLDVETIPGCKVWDLERAFKKIYARDTAPVDAVVVCGLNQIKWQPVEDIVASYRSLAQCIKEHSVKNRHVMPNTINIATLMYPPMYCTFRDPTHHKYPKYLTPETNLVSKIDVINKWIVQFNNNEIASRAVEGDADAMFCMHRYGLRPLGCGKEQTWKREHRWSSWFESADEMKLHLTHDWRAAVMHRMQLYFIHNTEW